jgi:Tfp pilus assembly protein PilW
MMQQTGHSPTIKAFTLVELLLYVSLSGAILLTLSMMLTQTLQIRVKNRTLADVDQQGIQAMQIMTQTVRNANTITTPIQGASGTSMAVTVPTAGNSPTQFTLASEVLRITEGAGSPVNITSSSIRVTSLQFSNLSRGTTPGTVRIQFTLAAANSTGRSEFDYQKTFTGSASIRK